MFEKRENEKLEFKKSTSELKQAIVSISSMLNKNNYGVLYFGVNNEGEIVGQQIGKDTTKDISVQIKNNIRPVINPSISIIKVEEKEIIKVEVFGEDTPYSAYGRYYIRSDDEDLVMSNAQLENFFINKNIDYSKWENEITQYGVEVIDEDLLINYINKGNEVGRISFIYRDVKDALIKLGLLKGDKLNNAGLYLFSNLKPWTLKLAIYPTDERISFIDNRIFKGNILECIEKAYRYIIENTRWRAEIKGMERVEIPEIPLEAIREIVVNSFAHMRVNNSSFSEIYITPTKIHVYNPGFLVKGKSPMDFADGTNGPIARNPLINTVLYLNKTIDSFGTGFGRVFNICNKEKIEYNYGNNEFGFFFDFIRTSIDNINVTKNVTINLSNVERDVFVLISSKKGIKRNEIAQELLKTEMTIHRAIKKLIELNLIKRVGSNKTGYWEIIE